MSLPWVAMAEQVLEPVPINFQPAEAIEDRLQCFFLVALLAGGVVGQIKGILHMRINLKLFSKIGT